MRIVAITLSQLNLNMKQMKNEELLLKGNNLGLSYFTSK